MPAAVKKSAPIKYTDKSAGQTGMVSIFGALKTILSEFVQGNYTVKSENGGVYEIYYNKEVTVAGRTHPALCFASLLIQKGFVGFYFFPVYTQPALKEKLAPGLLKCLKGKSCFHIKKTDPLLFEQVHQALQTGYQAYASNGWT